MSAHVVVHGHPRPRRFDQARFVRRLETFLPPGTTLETRPALLESVHSDEHACRIARTRVLDPMRPPHERVVCSTLERDDELGVLSGERPPTSRPPPDGVLSDAGDLFSVVRDLVPANERRLDVVHLALTDRLFGTYQRSDGRYHARVALAAGPHLLSTAGIVEAPARPRGYYAALAQAGGQAALERALSDEILVHGDERIPDFLVGAALQAYAWQVHGEAFCTEPDCLLFNAHWQKELFAVQAAGPTPCARHRAVFGL